MKLAKMIATLCVLVTAIAAHAQDQTPPVEMKSLDWLIGEWSGNVKFTMMGSTEETKMSWKVEREGQFLKQTSTMEMSGMKMGETAYIGWDKAKKKYGSYSFASWASTPRIEWGTFEGDKFVSVSEPWDLGMPTGPTVGRGTLIKKSTDEVFFTLEFKTGDKWEKVGEGTFKRKK